LDWNSYGRETNTPAAAPDTAANPESTTDRCSASLDSDSTLAAAAAAATTTATKQKMTSENSAEATNGEPGQ